MSSQRNSKPAYERSGANDDPLYLKKKEFDKILHWKLANQYGRVSWRLKVNSEEVIQTVTQAALSISHPDPDYELALRVGLLTAMRGVGVPIASAVLALVFPEQYCVIDFRVWRRVFGEPASGFSIGDYQRYMKKIRPPRRRTGVADPGGRPGHLGL